MWDALLRILVRRFREENAGVGRELELTAPVSAEVYFLWYRNTSRVSLALGIIPIISLEVTAPGEEAFPSKSLCFRLPARNVPSLLGLSLSVSGSPQLKDQPGGSIKQ